MKTILIIFLLGLSYCSFGQAQINGQLSGFGDIKTCEVYFPIGEFFNQWAPNDVPIQSDGTIHVDVNIKSASIIKIRIATVPLFLYIEPGDKVSFQIKKTHDKNNFLNIIGQNSAGNYWYNIYNYLPAENFSKQDYLTKEIPEKSPEQLLNDISFFLNNETRPLDSLLRKGLVTSSFVEVIKKDVYALHMKHLVRTLDHMAGQVSSPTATKIKTLEKLIYQTYPPTDPVHLRDRFGSGYAGSGTAYLKMLAATDSSAAKPTSDEIFGAYNEYLRLPLKFQEFLLGEALILEKMMSVETFPFEKGYNAFKIKFPLSSYIPVIDKILAKETVSMADKMVHFDTVSNFKTINELIAQYKGRRLLIDLWATWCIPCKMEFPYYKSIYDDLTNQDITPLYISIDDPLLKNLWKKTALQYDLKGYHIIANKALQTDIKNLVYKNEPLSIPRYILVGKKGEIIDNDAPRPSDKTRLLKELKDKLN